MQFTNEFTIPVGIDDAFDVLTDLERVAPCMPGATLEEVDGDAHRGRLKVKVGPMSLTYTGTATLTERSPEDRTARIEASGREKRGSGTASADVRATLQERDGETLVTVTTDIDVTGKPAQFGRGVMADVGARIIDRFADNLRDELSSDRAVPAAEPPESSPNGSAASTGPRKVEYRAPRDDALDLVDVAGAATARRLVPVLAVAVLVVLAILWRRRRA